MVYLCDVHGGGAYLKQCYARFGDQLNLQPISEAQVSRAVQDFLKLIFISARNPPAARFIKALKNYKPDILVPELAAAVEYKCIDTEEKLKVVLGEIAEDVKGYPNVLRAHELSSSSVCG